METKEALKHLINKGQKSVDVLHALKIVALYLQQYEAAAYVRDKENELIQIKKLNDEINNKE
jgi:hypothetical protein